MDTLILNFLLYLLYTIYSFLKCRYLTVHNILSIWFVFIALMGIISVNNGYYQIIYGRVSNLPLEPYLWCFISFLFLMLPLQKLNYKQILIYDVPQGSDENFITLIKLPILILFAFTIVYIPSVVMVLTLNNVSEAYHMQRVDGDELYSYSLVGKIIIWVGRKFYNWFFAILFFWSVWNINLSKKYSKFLIFVLLVSALPYFLRTISTGGRGGFIFFTLQLLLIVTPILFYISKKQKLKIVIFLSICATLSLPYIISMSEGRTEMGNESSIGSIVRYLGEPFPNLGNVLWNKVNTFLEGRRMYPELFGYTVDGSESQYDLFREWERVSGIPMLNYKTIYGDFYVEFGPVLALILIASIGILMNMYLRRRRLSFYQIPIYAYYIDVCSTAPLWFNRRNTGDLLIVLQLIIFSYMLRKYMKSKRIKNKE